MISLGVIVHVVLEVAEAVNFKPLPEQPINDGIPVFAHVIFISAMIIPLILSFLTFYFRGKTFKLISMVYSVLLVLLNVVHVVETILLHIENYSQVLTLLFVVVINVVLVLEINKWRREEAV